MLIRMNAGAESGNGSPTKPIFFWAEKLNRKFCRCAFFAEVFKARQFSTDSIQSNQQNNRISLNIVQSAAVFRDTIGEPSARPSVNYI